MDNFFVCEVVCQSANSQITSSKKQAVMLSSDLFTGRICTLINLSILQLISVKTL